MEIFSTAADQTVHPFILPDLPYDQNALSPHVSAETFDYHHKKHHQAYVTNLNNLLNESELKNLSLERIIINSHQNKQDAIFNNAAQVWNHSFYWHCMKQDGGGKPRAGALHDQICKDFGSFENFLSEFKKAGMSQFGSGWAWLVMENGALKVVKTSNAQIPITQGQFPIITCDVWEHAYYVDYRNLRAKYLDVFFEKLVNWDFAEENFANSLKK